MRKKGKISLLIVWMLSATVILNHFFCVFAETKQKTVVPVGAGGAGITVHWHKQGDTAVSPPSIVRLDSDTNAISGAGALTEGNQSTHFFKLRLGKENRMADAYCGNYGLHARPDVTYTCTAVNPSFNSKYTFRLIQAVTGMNAQNAVKSNEGEFVEESSYKAGQIAIWRILYLDSLGLVDSTYSRFFTYNPKEYTAMMKSMCQSVFGTTEEQYIAVVNNLMGNYINAAHKGTYSDYDVYAWSSGEQTDQVLYTAPNICAKEYGRIGLTKSSAIDSSKKVEGAVYGIYTDKSCSRLVSRMPATDEKGYSESELLPVYEKDSTTKVSYWVKEISVPGKYEVSSKVYGGKGIHLSPDKVYVLNKKYKVENTPYYFDIAVVKKGYEENGALSGAVFGLYEWNGSRYVFKRNLEYNRAEKKYETGTLYYTEENRGKFRVQEISPPPGYTTEHTAGKGKWSKEFTLTKSNKGTTVAAVCTNYPKTGSAEVEKKDAGTGSVLDGAVFGLYEWSGSGYEFKKNLSYNKSKNKYETGILRWTEKNGGKYKIAENKPQYKYYLSEPAFEKKFVITAYNQKFSYAAVNSPVTVNVLVEKKDWELNAFKSQGDADITATILALYAAEDISSPDGKSLYYQKDEKISQKYVDSLGRAEWTSLPLGNYYAREIKAGKGYVGDYKTKYPLNAESNYRAEYNMALKEVTVSSTIKNRVAKSPLAIRKQKEFASDGGEEESLKGAGFRVYLKSSLKQNPDGSYDLEGGKPVTIGEKGETELFTDERGYLQSIPLPYGTYLVVETTPPHNYKAVPPFEITISEDSSEPEEVVRVRDKEFAARLKVIKMDAKSMRAVLKENTGFKIRNTDTMEYVVQRGTDIFTTDQSGVMELFYPLRPGNYVLEEHRAPYGYTLKKEYVPIAVDMDSYRDYDRETMTVDIVIEYFNEPVRGRLHLVKTGEVLADYRENQFIYEMQGLPDAVYALYAAEDIFTGDNQRDDDGQPYLHYRKDELVGELTTDENGEAFMENLPLGNYYLIETQAPEGFVIDAAPVEVAIAYEGQLVPVVQAEVRVTNERQKAKASLVKTDRQSGKALESAVYGIYAAEDICGVHEDTVVPKDTLLEQVSTDENGKAEFTGDFPLGKYYLKEVQAPEGWLLSEDVMEVNVQYAGEKVTELKVETDARDYPTTVFIRKTDITGTTELEGAKLELYNEQNGLIESWISEGEAHMIYGLPAGEYRLHEEQAPEGYLIAEDITFTVSDEKDGEGKPVVTEVVMKDGAEAEKTGETEGREETEKVKDRDGGEKEKKTERGEDKGKIPHTGDEQDILVSILCMGISLAVLMKMVGAGMRGKNKT